MDKYLEEATPLMYEFLSKVVYGLSFFVVIGLLAVVVYNVFGG